MPPEPDLTAELDAAEDIVMGGRVPAQPVPEAAVASILRSALSDPASFTPRLREPFTEMLVHWQVRAVLAAFAKAGWTVTNNPEVPREVRKDGQP